MSDDIQPPSPEQHRIIAAHSAAEDVADFLRDACDRVREMRGDLDMSRDDMMELVEKYLAGSPSDVLYLARTALGFSAPMPSIVTSEGPASAGEFYDGLHGSGALGMTSVLERLLAAAPKMRDAAGRPIIGQSPAMECMVTLKNGGSVMGVLSRAAELGMMKMLAPNQEKQPDGRTKPVMVEMFFGEDQITMVAVTREMEAAGPKIVL